MQDECRFCRGVGRVNTLDGGTVTCANCNGTGQERVMMDVRRAVNAFSEISTIMNQLNEAEREYVATVFNRHYGFQHEMHATIATDEWWLKLLNRAGGINKGPRSAWEWLDEQVTNEFGSRYTADPDDD